MDSLKDDERWQFGTYLWSIFVDFQDEYHASKKLRLDDYHWDFQKENMLFYLGKRGIRNWWDSLELKLDPEFVEYVNGLLEGRIT